MRRLRKALLVLPVLGLALAACSSDSSTANADVKVDVKDVHGDSQWGLSPDPSSVKAGKVTFSVANTGSIDHEMVVLKTDDAFDQLKVDSAGKVGEDGSIGEVSEFKAGATKSVTLDMSAGSYVLVCNIEGHYTKGMRAAFTVT